MQTSNHESEQKKGVSADLCQKLGRGTQWEDDTAVLRCTNQTLGYTTAASTPRFSNKFRIRARKNKNSTYTGGNKTTGKHKNKVTKDENMSQSE